MRVDRASREITAPAERIYQALTNREAVERCLPPEGAQGVMHEFEPRPGGAIRLTLVFDSPGETGARKSSSNTDVVHGEFLDLVQDQQVRQRFMFVSEDPAFAGAMVMTWTLTPTKDGTQVAVAAENVPVGISPQDHEVGLASSLANLAAYVA
jgi:uncharacterized protein YndB with AHSA1/START domain